MSNVERAHRYEQDAHVELNATGTTSFAPKIEYVQNDHEDSIFLEGNNGTTLEFVRFHDDSYIAIALYDQGGYPVEMLVSPAVLLPWIQRQASTPATPIDHNN